MLFKQVSYASPAMESDQQHFLFCISTHGPFRERDQNHKYLTIAL